MRYLRSISCPQKLQRQISLTVCQPHACFGFVISVKHNRLHESNSSSNSGDRFIHLYQPIIHYTATVLFNKIKFKSKINYAWCWNLEQNLYQADGGNFIVTSSSRKMQNIQGLRAITRVHQKFVSNSHTHTHTNTAQESGIFIHLLYVYRASTYNISHPCITAHRHKYIQTKQIFCLFAHTHHMAENTFSLCTNCNLNLNIYMCIVYTACMCCQKWFYKCRPSAVDNFMQEKLTLLNNANLNVWLSLEWMQNSLHGENESAVQVGRAETYARESSSIKRDLQI